MRWTEGSYLTLPTLPATRQSNVCDPAKEFPRACLQEGKSIQQAPASIPPTCYHPLQLSADQTSSLHKSAQINLHLFFRRVLSKHINFVQRLAVKFLVFKSFRALTRSV